MIKIKTIILAGGKGTRLGKQNVPKSLMSFLNETILEHNLASLPETSEYFFVLGYESEKILRFLNKAKFPFEYRLETKQEGTGGWLRYIKKSGKDRLLDQYILTENFIVCNGDNIMDVEWIDVLLEHADKNAYLTMVVTRVEDAHDMGTVTTNGRKIITSFKEKTGIHQPGWISSGFYLFSKKGLDYITNKMNLNKTGKIMLEKDVFPELVKTGKMCAYKHTGNWADTGTITRIKNAEKMFNEADEDKFRKS